VSVALKPCRRRIRRRAPALPPHESRPWHTVHLQYELIRCCRTCGWRLRLDDLKW